MKRGPPYGDANQNPYAASQMQQGPSHRMPHNSAMNDFMGRPDSYAAKEERQFPSGKGDEQWQWDRDAQQMSPTLYRDGQGSNAGRSVYPSQVSEVKSGSNQESRVHTKEHDMEIGYEENTAPQTLEGLEQKFRDNIMKLTKEQVDAEDAENLRHKEKIIEINNQYQEKLSALRARHASRREELLLKESQERLKQYQLAGMNHYPNNSGPGDMARSHHGYSGAPPGEPQPQYGGQFDSYRQRSEFYGRERMQGADTRVPTPGGGRVYSTGPRYY